MARAAVRKAVCLPEQLKCSADRGSVSASPDARSLLLQSAAEGAVGGVDGRTLQVGDAEAGGVEHGRNDLDVPGLGLV
jgi:hypothetical protein